MNFKNLAASLLCSITMASHAQVVEDLNVFSEPILGGEPGFSLTVFQKPSGDTTTILLKKTDDAVSGVSSISPITWTVDEGADYYLVRSGDVFSGVSVAAGNFTPLFATDHPYSIEVGLHDAFFLGIVTGLGFTPAGPNRNVFGWVELQNSDAGVEILNSAVAYGFEGVIVGTVTPVPEPGTGPQMALGMVALVLLLRTIQNGSGDEA